MNVNYPTLLLQEIINYCHIASLSLLINTFASKRLFLEKKQNETFRPENASDLTHETDL